MLLRVVRDDLLPCFQVADYPRVRRMRNKVNRRASRKQVPELICDDHVVQACQLRGSYF